MDMSKRGTKGNENKFFYLPKKITDTHVPTHVRTFIYDTNTKLVIDTYDTVELLYRTVLRIEN